MNAQMRARRRRGVEVIPEFRRLVAHVPAAFGAARRKYPFLGAGRSSSRRMPAINPSKPYLASASFRPSVLRAAERAAGGRVGSMVSIGGQGSTMRSRFHSCRSDRGKHTSPEISCRYRRAWPETARGRKRPCVPARSSHWNPCRATTAARASSAAQMLPENEDALCFQLVEMIHGGLHQGTSTAEIFRAAEGWFLPVQTSRSFA